MRISLSTIGTWAFCIAREGGVSTVLHISLNLHLVALIFFKYVPAPMTAFRYCVWLWWNERERGWSSAAPAGVWVWISHTHARAEADACWFLLGVSAQEMERNGIKRALLIWRSETWNLWSRSAATIQPLLKHDLETRVPLLLVAFLCSATRKTAFHVRKYQV
jgi:hypothetical protein